MKQNSNARDVESILNQLNIMYEKEKTFDDLKYRSKLRFDFYVPKYNLCIEFNGIQHYEYVEYFHRNKAQFQQQIYKDGLKEKYCQDNSIFFLELPCDLTVSEVQFKLMNTLNKIGEFDFELLPRIDEFLNLNESCKVYMNQLYDEYQSMLKQLNINHATNYDTFNDYVIDYWNLTSQHLVKEKNKYYDCWINESIEDMLDDNDTVYQFIQDMFELDEVKSQQLIPVTHLYQLYKNYVSDHNPAMKSMSQRKFLTKAENHLTNLSYELSSERKLPEYLEKRGLYNQERIFNAMEADYLTPKESKSYYFIKQDTTESNNSVISYLNHTDINMIKDRRVVFVYRQYEQYCEENALSVMGKQKFNQQLESRLNVVRKNRALKNLNQDETDLEAYTEEAINPDKRVKAWVEV